MEQSNDSAPQMLFDRVALLSGRPVYWTAQPGDALKHARCVAGLLQWCLQLPDVQLGIDPKGIGLIVRSVFDQQGKPFSSDEDRRLDRAGAREAEAIPWQTDPERFGEQAALFLSHLEKATDAPGDYVWVSGEEAADWARKSGECLYEYGSLFDTGTGTETPLLGLFARHRCTLFSRFDATLLDAIQRRLAEPQFLPRQGQRLMEMLDYHSITGASLQQLPQPLYWSWRMVDFGATRGNLICTPLLALWNYWPASRRWAPVPPEGTPAPPASTADQAAHLLEEGFWKQLETLFAVLRMSFEFGVTEPKFAGHEAKPPAFYFAAPLSPPSRPEEYLSQDQEALHALVRTCLGSEDPAAEEVAWGVMERDLVALRREVATSGAYQANYLLLPLGLVSSTPAEQERDLEFVADRLTFLEFSMGHAARDVSTDADDLGTRQALWGGTLDTASDLIGQALSFLADLAPAHRSILFQVSGDLQAVLLSLQPRVEHAASDAEQLVRTLRGYIDGTEDLIRRQLTLAPVGKNVMNLRRALVDAYPYHYLQQPVESVATQAGFLRTSVETILNNISEILQQADRLARERQERWTRWMGVLITLLALFVGLPSLLPGVTLSKQTYPTWLARYLPLATLEAAGRLAVGLLVIALFAVVLAPLIGQALAWIRPRREAFWKHLRQFHRLARQSIDALANLGQPLPGAEGEESAEVGGKLEDLDQKATERLVAMWSILEPAQKAKGRRFSSRWNKVQTWLHNAGRFISLVKWPRFSFPWSLPPDVQTWRRGTRRLIHLTYLFDLRPEVLPLPRALCLLRYRSTDFTSRSIISDWEFERLLRRAGFESDKMVMLDHWLSHPDHQRQMNAMDIGAFAGLLKERGVSADPAQRNPDQWQGPIIA